MQRTTTVQIGTKRAHDKNNVGDNKKLKKSQPNTVAEWETLMISRINPDNDFVNIYRDVVLDWYTYNEFNYNYDRETYTSMTYKRLETVYMATGAIENEDELYAYFMKLLDINKMDIDLIDDQEISREYSTHCIFPNNDEECECPECHGNHEGNENDEEFEICEDCMDGATGDCGWCTYHKFACGNM